MSHKSSKLEGQQPPRTPEDKSIRRPNRLFRYGGRLFATAFITATGGFFIGRETAHQATSTPSKIERSLKIAADLLAREADVPPAIVIGKGLHSPQKLAGAKASISPQQERQKIKQLQESTVQVRGYSRGVNILKNGSRYKISGLCTGTKIAPNLILTAAHCIDAPKSINVKTKYEAANVVDVTKSKYAILSPVRKQSKTYSQKVLALASGISIDYENSTSHGKSEDLALIKVKPVSINSKFYDALPAFDINNDNRQPLPGEQVASINAGVNPEVTGMTTYLGRLTGAAANIASGSIANDTVDIVATSETSNARNPLLPGASGSLGAGVSSGYIYGPISAGVGDTNMYYQKPPYSKTVSTNIYARYQDQANLGLDLSSFNGIDGRAVITEGAITRLEHGLAAKVAP